MTTTYSRSLPVESNKRLGALISGGAIGLGLLTALVIGSQLTGAAATLGAVVTQINQWLGASAAANSKVYWYMARAAGVVAYLLLWGSVAWGILVSSKLVNDWVKPALVYELHKFLSMLALIVGLFHGLILLGDTYMSFSVLDILIPFRSAYQPFWVGLGILGFYLTAILVGSFYIKKHIGHRTWRLLHFSSFGVWVMTTLHGLVAGSDTSTVLMKVIYTVAVVSVGYLLTHRLATAKSLQPAAAHN